MKPNPGPLRGDVEGCGVGGGERQRGGWPPCPHHPRDEARAPSSATSGFQLAAAGRWGSRGHRDLPSEVRRGLVLRRQRPGLPPSPGASQGAVRVAPSTRPSPSSATPQGLCREPLHNPSLLRDTERWVAPPWPQGVAKPRMEPGYVATALCSALGT